MHTVHTHTRVPIYGGNLHVYVGEDFEKLLDRHKIPQPYQDYAGIVAFTMSGVLRRKNGTKVSRWAVVCRPNIDMDTMAHESVHVALNIFDDRGVEPDTGNQEPLAYLVGWVAGRVERAVVKWHHTKQETTANV